MYLIILLFKFSVTKLKNFFIRKFLLTVICRLLYYYYYFFFFLKLQNEFCSYFKIATVKYLIFIKNIRHFLICTILPNHFTFSIAILSGVLFWNFFLFIYFFFFRRFDFFFPKNHAGSIDWLKTDFSKTVFWNPSKSSGILHFSNQSNGCLLLLQCLIQTLCSACRLWCRQNKHLLVLLQEI